MPADGGPARTPAPTADGAADTRADLPAAAVGRNVDVTAADLPMISSGDSVGRAPVDLPAAVVRRDADATAAGRDKERDKELARLNCPRPHCHCADPTVCPSITEMRRPPRPAPVPPLEKPPAPGHQDPGFTRLMAQAVVRAATTPIPVIRPDHPADAGAGPGTGQHGGSGPWISLRGKRRNRREALEPPSAAAGTSPSGGPASAAPGSRARFRAGVPLAPRTGEPYAPAVPGVPPSPRPSDGAPWPPAPPAAGDDRFGRATSPPRPYVAGQAGGPPAPAATSSGTAPRPSAGDRRQATTGQRRPAASQQEKDLARRNCLRLRCVCPDPTVCPALAVKRSPVTSGAQEGWQMPAQERTQAPGFTTMMSLAVAPAATMRLPVVPADAAPYTDGGTARSPAGKLLGRLKADHMLRNTLFLIMSTGLQAALGFAFWIVVARLFTTADVGRGSSLISAIGLIAFFALLGLNSAVVRYLPTAKDPNSLITATVLLVGGFGALIAGIYIFATPIFAPKIAFVAHQPLLALVFILLAAATAVNLLTDSVFIASRKASYTALTDGGIGGVAKIGFSVALAGTGAYGVFSASAGGFAAAALASLILMASAVHWRPSLKNPVQILKPLIKFSFANYAGNAMGMLPTLVVPLIILDRLGPSSAAYYFVAFQLANLLYAAGGAIEQTFLAEGSQADADWRSMLRRSLRLLVALFVPMCLVVVVGAHWVLLAFGVKYSQFGTPSLILLAAAAIPIGANDWLQTVLRLAGALKAIVWSGATCAISVCALAWFLAPFGLTALSASWAIGSALGALVAGIGFMAVRRRDLEHPYEGRYVPRPAAEGQPERSEQPVG